MAPLTPNRRQRIGRWGETRAAEFLTGQGWEVLDRNVRTPYGEIDLLVRKERLVAFVEVKTRTSTAYGPPETGITPRKREHMIAAAQAYLQIHPEMEDDWRIDVIAILRKPGQDGCDIAYFENAIS